MMIKNSDTCPANAMGREPAKTDENFKTGPMCREPSKTDGNFKTGLPGREPDTPVAQCEAAGEAAGEAARKPLGIYIHIPFCVSKCRYCDFLSFPKSDNKAWEMADLYFKALKAEIMAYGRMLSGKYEADTVFIGGGTPSAVPAEYILSVANVLKKAGLLGTDTGLPGCEPGSPEVEFTIEANPGTVCVENLLKYRQAGINRVSFGAQSFSETCLEKMGRIHTPNQIAEAAAAARRAGFSNINLDLMFGVPGQTIRDWEETLAGAIALKPEHISFYSLQIEEGTPFYQEFREGTLDEAPEDVNRFMYHRAAAMLQENGYKHYEISNCALPGSRCRHNLKYWSMEEYIGLGLGAHSYLKGVRYNNPADLEAYCTGFAGSNADKELYLKTRMQAGHLNTRDDDLEEFMFTGLRRIEGIQGADFLKRFGVPVESVYGDEIARLENEGLLKISRDAETHTREITRVALTARGIDISNYVLSEFIRG